MKKLLITILSALLLMSISTVNILADGNVAKIGSTEYPTLQDAISAASSGDTIEIIKEGKYPIPSPIDGVTIDGKLAGGKEKVIFDISSGAGQLASTSGEVGFENVTFIFGNNGYTGFQHPGAINFTNCNINGYFQSYGTMNFTDCVFTQTNSNYSMWCYAGDVTYTRCTFNEAKAALNLYNEGNNSKDAAGNVIPWVVTVEDCSFVYTGDDDNSYAGILLKTIVGNVSDARCKNMGYKLVLKGTNTASSNWKGTKESGYGQTPSTSKLVGSVDGLVWVQQAESDISSVFENDKQVWPKVLEPVAQVGDTKYVSLQDALNDFLDEDIFSIPTIEIIKDIEDAEGVKTVKDKRCIIDFNNHTYKIKKAGTNTDSEGFVIEANSYVEFKDGTITLDSDNNSISTVIKNCGDMMLNNMKVIDVKNNNDKRVVTNKCGNVMITNNTSIVANNGDIALDTCKDDAFVINAQVTVDNANIAGNIEVDGGILDFKDGKLFGKIIDTKKTSNLIKVYNGLFSEAIDNDIVAEGNICVANQDSNTKLDYPYTIDIRNKKIDINTDAKQENNEEPKKSDKIDQTDIETANEIVNEIIKSKVDLLPVVKTLANKPEIVTESIIAKAKSQEVKDRLEATNDNEVEIIVEAKLVQEIIEVKKNDSILKSFKVDVVPMYEIKAVNKSNDKTESLSDSKALQIVGETIKMKINLPTSFGIVDDEVWIKHYLHDGSSKVYESTIAGDDNDRYIEFENPDGFSVFEFSLAELTPDSKPNPNPTPDSRPRYKIPNTGVEGTTNNHSLLKLSSISLLVVGTYMVIKKKKDN